MSYNRQDTPLLSALAHLFDHEEDLPADPVARLRHVGWVFAQKWYESGESGGCTFGNELTAVCNGDRGRLDWCPTSFAFRHPCPGRSPARGWFLDMVVHVDNIRKNCKFAYMYYSPVTNKKHGIDFTIRLEHHEFACFVLEDQNFYWHSHDGYSTIVSDHGGHYGVFHCVAIRAATMTYARYDPAPAGTCLAHRLFTTSHESWVSVKRFGVDPTFQHVPDVGNWAIHNQLFCDPAHDPVLEHNEGTNATRNRLAKLAWNLRAITKHAHAARWTELPHLSAQLSHQRRSRFVRIARTLLIHRAQQCEEARARDPIRKCAACAIEAVKSQLALGLGHKRQRVSAA